MPNNFATVWLLAAMNAIATCGVPMTVLVGSIVGAELAPSERWATLPIATMVIGTAMGVIPAVRGMHRLGRQLTFGLFILLGSGALLLAGEALALRSFWLFCLATTLLGGTAAALQQIRFAAMEAVPLERGPTAASIIMFAGIGAALIGPELALAGRQLTTVDYQGSYRVGAALVLASGLLLLFYRPAPLASHAHGTAGRSTAQLLGSPAILLAIVSGASAFMVMSFIMTATPISMHLHNGHSLEDTKWVIQSHIAAMFLPSLLTTWLFRLLGIRGLMWAGLGCYVATIAIGLADVSVFGFWSQLVMLGIGWNFLFVSGTALLPTAYKEGEQFRVQALNDSVVFGSQAIASLSAGLAISLLQWQSLLLICLLPMLLISSLLLTQRRAAPA